VRQNLTRFITFPKGHYMQLALNTVLSVAAALNENPASLTIPQANTIAIVSEESQVPEDANPLSSINLARLLASCGDCV